MRIFFVCQRVPFPPDRGDKIITFHEVRHLAKDHEVHVFCLADGARDLKNVAPLQRYVKSVTAIAVSDLKKKLRIMRALVSGQSLSVAALDEPKLHRIIRKRFFEL